MKILGAGDFHGDIEKTKKLAELAEKEKVDLIILCGDLQEEDSIDNILAPFKEKNQKILLIGGNHESLATAEFLASINEAKNIHGYSVRYQDIGIFGCAGADVGLTSLTEEQIFDYLKQGFDKVNYLKKKIMVTHIHPSYTMMEKMSHFIRGSKAVTKAIDEFKPDILICGHVHEAHGLEEQLKDTKIINPGPDGKIFEL